MSKSLTDPELDASDHPHLERLGLWSPTEQYLTRKAITYLVIGGLVSMTSGAVFPESSCGRPILVILGGVVLVVAMLLSFVLSFEGEGFI